MARVKVDRLKLIECIKAAKVAKQVVYDKEYDRYGKAMLKWEALVESKYPATSWEYAEVGSYRDRYAIIGVRVPVRPEPPAALTFAQDDRALSLLELASDESVSINTDDYRGYI